MLSFSFKVVRPWLGVPGWLPAEMGGRGRVLLAGRRGAVVTAFLSAWGILSRDCLMGFKADPAAGEVRQLLVNGSAGLRWGICGRAV